MPSVTSCEAWPPTARFSEPCMPDVFHGLFEVDVAHDPHLREVQSGDRRRGGSRFRGTRESSSTSRCRCGALVLDRGHGDQPDVGESVSLRLGCGGSLRCGRDGGAEREGLSAGIFSSLVLFGYWCSVTSSRKRRSSGTLRASASLAWRLSVGGNSCLCRRYRVRNGRS